MVFERNERGRAGGGLWLGSTWIRDATQNTFRENAGQSGGALWLGNSSPDAELRDNLFCENEATRDGGAVFVNTLGADQQWWNNRWLANRADNGGAIASYGAALQVLHGNLLGNSAGSGSAIVTQSSVYLRSSLVGWNTGSAAIEAAADGEGHLTYSLFYANAVDDVKGAVDVDIATAFDVDPMLHHFAPALGCDAEDDYYNFQSPLVDLGDPANLADPDGSRNDIGAWGALGDTPSGPWAIDLDQDGTPRLYDCVDADADIHPGIVDGGYDGIDANCDLADDFDLDFDGWSPPEDCDDADPSKSPDGVDTEDADGNCDLIVDYDGDGSPRSEDCDDTDPEVHPGAIEDPGTARDLDCTGPNDVVRGLVPATCATSAGRTGGVAGWAALLVIAARRRGRNP
jgi:hypothetical protein